MNWGIRQLLSLTFLGLCIALAGCGDGESGDENFNADLKVVGSYDGLSGQLIFIEQRAQPNFRIASLDLSSGEVTTLWNVPENGWIYELAMGRDGRLLITYSAPSVNDEPQLDRSGLYLLDVRSSNAEPIPLIEPREADEFNLYPVWSSDQQRIYLSQIKNDPLNPGRQLSSLIELDADTSHINQLLPAAMTPSLNADETLMAYLHVNPVNQVRSIPITDGDWNSEENIVEEFEFYDISNQIFSPAGDYAYFSVLEDPLESGQQSFWEQIIFGKNAFAHADHNLPADWWRKNLFDEQSEKLTDLSLIMYDGVFSPDGSHFAFSSQEGLHVMNPDGSELQLLIRSRAIRNIYWTE